MEIKLKNITYYNKYDKKVLDDISYNFEEANIYGIIGPSGSGKSYLGKMIAGLLKLEYGQIEYDDSIVKGNNQKKNFSYLGKNIGYVYENSEEQFTMKTVYLELLNIIKEINYKVEKADERIQDILKMIGLDDSYINRDPITLSTGEMNKLALAKSLIYNPSVIILDEPWIGLDTYEQNQLIKLIRMLKKRTNKTIILITNNLEFLAKIADNILVLKDGSIIKSGNKIDVFKDTRFLKKNGIQAPNTIMFSDLVLKKKKIKIGYRDEVNDLIKDIYRYAQWGCDKDE